MKRSQVFLFFYIAAPLLLVARVLQRFYMIDAATGFYRDGLAAAGTAVTVLFVAFPLVARLLCRLSRPVERRFPTPSGPLAIGAFFAALCLAVETVRTLLTGSGAVSFLVAFLSAVFAACLVLRGLAALEIVRSSDWLAPVGTFYAGVRLVVHFAAFAGEVTVADTLFSILSMCLLALFFFADGKMQVGLADEKVASSFFAFGLSAALFCAAIVLPDLIDMILGGKFVLYGGDFPDLSSLGFLVLTLCAVFSARPPLDNNE